MKGTSPSRASRIAANGKWVPRWEVRTLINSLGRGSHGHSVFRVDLAKNVFAVPGVDAYGKPALVRPLVPRSKLHELIATLPPCVLGMEPCSGLR